MDLEDNIFSVPGLEKKELDEIFQRIDDALFLRQQINHSLSNEGKNNPEIIVPSPPTITDLTPMLRDIATSEAPYYVISGNKSKIFIKRLHNIIVKIFGKKQAYFNDLIHSVLVELYNNLKLVGDYQNKIIILTREQSLLFNELLSEIEKLKKRMDGLEQVINQQNELKSRINSLEKRLKLNDEKMKIKSDRIKH